jgi:hypothetical protein
MEIEPPIEQTHLLVLFSAGAPRTMTVGEPGAQGPAMAGKHGVGTPIAAAVSTLQVPNGGIFAIGKQSRMFAAGLTSPVTVGIVTTSADGAVPDVQASCAPIVTSWAIKHLQAFASSEF